MFHILLKFLHMLSRFPFFSLRGLNCKLTLGLFLIICSITSFAATTSQTLGNHAVKKRSLVSTKKPKRYIVVIDAGHGGKDTGAIGFSGVKEKDVALAVARDLAKQMNAQPNMRAILTRQRDNFIPLRTRLALARRGRADLFIAIHADAEANKAAQGASVYTLSQRGASREAARWLAKHENYVSLDEVAFAELPDQSQVVRSTLIDMAQTATMNESLQLGRHVLHALHKVTILHYRSVEQAPFMVLKAPDIPSILVELGYLSNVREERRLVNVHYQHQLARALLAGVKHYLLIDGIRSLYMTKNITVRPELVEGRRREAPSRRAFQWHFVLRDSALRTLPQHER